MTIVDVGCGDGQFLEALNKKNNKSWKLVGVDSSPQAIQSLSSRNIKGVLSNFESMTWLTSPPDVITMFHVIEHVEQPKLFFKKAYQMLRNNGLLIVDTPSFDGWDAKLFKKRYWGGYHTPRHLTIFDKETLTKHLIAAGFEIVSIKYLYSPSFWLLSFNHYFKYEKKWTRLARLFDIRCLPMLGFALVLDFFQKCVRNKTSNIRVVAMKKI